MMRILASVPALKSCYTQAGIISDITEKIR